MPNSDAAFFLFPLCLIRDFSINFFSCSNNESDSSICIVSFEVLSPKKRYVRTLDRRSPRLFPVHALFSVSFCRISFGNLGFR